MFESHTDTHLYIQQSQFFYICFLYDKERFLHSPPETSLTPLLVHDSFLRGGEDNSFSEPQISTWL